MKKNGMTYNKGDSIPTSASNNAEWSPKTYRLPFITPRRIIIYLFQFRTVAQATTSIVINRFQNVGNQ